MPGCFCTGRCRHLGYCPNTDPFGPGRIAPHNPPDPIIGPGQVRPKRRLRWSRYAKAWVDAGLADAISRFRNPVQT